MCGSSAISSRISAGFSHRLGEFSGLEAFRGSFPTDIGELSLIRPYRTPAMNDPTAVTGMPTREQAEIAAIVWDALAPQYPTRLPH